jgi:hypothetical protein
MEALDGNAIAGTLMAIFGTEMTTATAACAGCGRRSLVGELDVYLRGPGTVVRCGHCEDVVMVVVEAHRLICVDLSGLVALQLAE